MHIQTLKESPRNHRGGQVSYLLLAKNQFGSENLVVTWVECSPGSAQGSHAHLENEQAYIIVRGQGQMTVSDQEQLVGPGTIVFVPKNTTHLIRNLGEEPLLYISVTSPPLSITQTPQGFSLPEKA